MVRIGAGILTLVVWLISVQAHALLPAALPKVDSVPAGEPLAIDGDWVISTNNKRIRIEAGRGYALDSWQHALILTIQPGMVVFQNMRETPDGAFSADDLPLLGKAQLKRVNEATLEVTVTTGLGPISYQLLAVNPPAPSGGADDSANGSYGSDAEAPPNAQPNPLPPPVRPGPPASIEERPVIAPLPKPITKPIARPVVDVPEFVSSDSFTGCQPDEKSGPANANPRQRIESRVDRVTRRQFAGFTLDEVRTQVGDAEQLGLCWMRLDGVWSENRPISLDRSKDQPALWGTDSPELIVLANGNYTDVRHLFIGSVGRDDEEIWISDGVSPNGFTRFESNDGLTLEETLIENGPVKVYTATSATRLGTHLTLDLTASKRARLRLDNVTYLRPKLRMSEDAMQEQTASDDAFLLQANLENLTASRRGYDVVKQDPFFLLNNRKLAVFARFDPQRYYIAEQHIIPVGYKFMQDGVQGMVYNKSMVTNAREYQNSIAVSLGATIEGKTDPAGFAGNASVSVDASVSWRERMEESKHVAQALGYSRAKKYALVVDHPFVTLSDDFIDAIGDAVRFGNYDNIINQFGTHYPYAVTYGAAAKITQAMTEESYSKLTEWNAGVSADIAGGALGQGGSVRTSISGGSVNGSSGSMGSEDTTFVAVGGNGSWNENGYALGPTPYPVLLDLRPLYELLNHMNFPDQPVVYTQVRAELKREIEQYMALHANQVSDQTLLPAIQPKKIETWHLYVREVWCTGKGVALVADATGTLEMEAYRGNRGSGYKSALPKTLTTKCKKKKELQKYGYKRTSPGLIEITGTREQIAAYALNLRLQWRYTPSSKKKWRHHKKTFVGLSALKNGLPVNKSADQIWKVGSKGKPDFSLRVRAKRIR